MSFTIDEGEYAGIIGPNGSGKTTLLKLLLGILQPTSGTIRILGRDASEANARIKVGYVPQRITQLDFSFPATVEEVVMSGRTSQKQLFQWSSDADRRACAEAMERTNILHLHNRRIGELSGGERQRAFIARALATEPSILILDEPTVGIDAASQAAFYEFLKELNGAGMTIIFVSHDTHALMHEVKCVLCLQEGELCHCSLEDLKDSHHLHSHMHGGTHHHHHAHA